jgi:intracellular sulfur oxidation DsrE/DsrF family protein
MQTNQGQGPKQAIRQLGLASGLLTVLATVANAANPPMITPGIPGEGPMHPLPDAAYQPQRDVTYKIIFAISKAGDTPQEVSPSLVRVARTVNLYVSAGVPISHLKFVAVANGAATATMLDDEHYKAKFGVANPNAALIHKLRAAGVDVAVCGQAVLESGFETAWISHDVTLALSALTTITVLQQQGYALMPL